MNNPNNPFVPKGTLLDLQDRRRKQLKLAVFCALSVGVVGLTMMLGVQGCNPKKSAEETFPVETVNTNVVINIEPTNSLPMSSNTVAYNPPVDTNTAAYNPPPIDPLPLVGGAKYKIAKGDTLAVIAKKNGVSLKALEAANPKLDPKHLKINAEVTIPAATPKAVSTSGGAMVDGNSYTVKSGDSLGKIAKSHGTTVNAIKAANSLKTDRINLGQKLIIPSKAEAAPATPVVAPVIEPVVAPPTAPVLNSLPK